MVLVDINVNSKSKYNGKDAFNDFQFAVVDRVYSKGKKIIFELSDGMYLLSFLSMSGRWQLKEEAHSGLSLCFGKLLRVIEDEGIRYIPMRKFKIYFDDVDRRGALDYVDQEEFERRMKSVGPDFLSDEVTLEMYSAAIRNKRIKGKLISDFMLDQKKFSGVGNYLRAHILYECRISPYRTLDSLSNEDISNLWKTTIKTLKESYEAGGFTQSRYLDLEGIKGTFGCKVYNQKKDEYGNDVEVITKFGATKRTIHWVPEIQK